MKVSIIMGRGIEGCGVTKFTVEQTKWLEKNGHEYTVYASSDKNWTRKKSHEMKGVVELKFTDIAAVDKMIAGCNASDVVIVNSLPSARSEASSHISKGHPELAVIEFKRAIEQINRPMTFIQHDHSSIAIRRNAGLNECVEKAAALFGHSPTNDFARMIAPDQGGLQDFFGDDTPVKTVTSFQPGIDFDSLRAKYWKPITEQDARHNKWIGRTTPWKGYKQMFKFHNEYLTPAGYMTTFEGIEKSPAYIVFRQLSPFNPHLTGPTIADVDLTNAYGDLAYVFGPYVNDAMLERMSRVGFGYQLSLLDERYIHRSIEYTHCEVVCTGAVPVFRKKYGERCTHRKHGDKLIDCKNTGTIWLDDDNMLPAFQLLDKLAKDDAMRDDYREQAFEFYRDHQDSEYTFAEMMTTIKGTL